MRWCIHCRRRGGVALVLGLLLAPAVRAGLGERVETVARDHAAPGAPARKVTPMAHCDLHEITSAQGLRIREYVARDGTVFATTWSGPAMPDLKVALAGHYAEYHAAAQAHRGGHHVFSMSSDRLVIRVVKLPRGLVGSARVPALVPAGMDLNDIR